MDRFKLGTPPLFFFELPTCSIGLRWASRAAGRVAFVEVSSKGQGRENECVDISDRAEGCLALLKLASRTSMMLSPDDVPEPDGKPSKPACCEVGFSAKSMRNCCGCDVSELLWNGQIGYWFVKCSTESKA